MIKKEPLFSLGKTSRKGVRKAKVVKGKKESKGLFICISNLKIHLAIRASSPETAAPALP